MLDLRKLFFAAAVLAVSSVTAFAQTTPPLSCTAQSAGNPRIRAEGVAELTGDVIITCSGGTPTPANTTLRQTTMQVFTNPSINVTSRILAGSSPNAFTEALMFIDEPTPVKQTLCGGPDYPYSIPTGSGQALIVGVCGNHLGSTLANAGDRTYDPDIAAGSFGGVPGTRGNAYQARLASNTSLIWQGIPFDPPGTLFSRTIRLTNIRVNASQLGVPSGGTASVRLDITSNASGVFNPINLPIANPSPTVATALQSLDFSIVDPETCLQCESLNGDFSADTSKALAGNANCGSVAFRLRFTERFPEVFKRRSVNPDPANPATSQDDLGVIYQTESGFYKAAANGNRWPVTPTSAGNASRTAAGTGALGLADHGTRLIVRFANVQNGIQVWMPLSAPVFSLQVASGTTTTGIAGLVNTDPNGAGPFSPVSSSVTTAIGPVAQLSVVGGAGQFAYELVSFNGTGPDTTTIERVELPVVIAYKANTSANLPSLGTSTSNGALAPLSTVATSSATAPLPRFVDTGAARNMLTINSCRTNLLFPFVSNMSGFDTGLAIVNTSKDPFGTAVQTGACTVNFYGKVGTSNVCLSYPSPSVTGGEHFVWSLSAGGAVNATAGFQGYVIAQCQFQYAHGFAFVSDLGASRLAMGYLALVMDASVGTRTGSVSETLGH